MKLIVALGNPGTEYARTRHNAGWMAAERVIDRLGLMPGGTKFHAATAEGRVAGEKVVLLRPQTYMNRSGLTVGEAVRFFKLEPTDLIVLVDDVNLPVGKIRLRAGGSAGGQNGLKDIQRVLATPDYPRLRIGIDPPGRVPRVDYVLQPFTQAQRDELDPALDRVADAVKTWIDQGIEKAMTAHNGE
ncbi:MAG: aminoacyl-tRNA hydrolase [Planctomycetota bacterium]